MYDRFFCSHHGRPPSNTETLAVRQQSSHNKDKAEAAIYFLRQLKKLPFAQQLFKEIFMLAKKEHTRQSSVFFLFYEFVDRDRLKYTMRHQDAAKETQLAVIEALLMSERVVGTKFWDHLIQLIFDNAAQRPPTYMPSTQLA